MDFENRLDQARKASLKSGILTLVGVILVVGALVSIAWQYREARIARKDAAEEATRAAELAQKLFSVQEDSRQLSADLGGKLKVAENTIQSLHTELKNALESAGKHAEAAAANARYQAASKELEDENKNAAQSISHLNNRVNVIQTTEAAKMFLPKEETTPKPANSGKAILQVIVGNAAAKAKVLALRDKLGEGYNYTNVVVAKRVPATTEVRYYFLQEDKAEAEKILGELKSKAGLQTGRISYVLDPDQPRRFFQIAVAKDAIQ